MRFRKFLTLCLVILGLSFSSCSDDKENGKWVESINGMKVYVPKDFEDKYDKNTLSCECFTSDGEVPIYAPPFKISVKDKKGKTLTRETNLPTIMPDSLLRHNEKNSKDAKWYIAGKFEDGKTQGYAFELRVISDSIITTYEYGNFKDDDLVKGYKYRYNPDSEKSTISVGRFKNGALYQGTRQILYRDSMGEKVIGVWESDGSLNPTYLNFIKRHYKIMSSLGYDAAQKNASDIALTHKYFFWQKYKWWFFIGLSIIGFFCSFVGLGFIENEEINGQENIDYYKLKPWTCKGAYLRWIFFPFGFHFIYLHMSTSYLFYSLISWVGIVSSSKFLVLYGLTPEFWSGLLRHEQPWQLYLFCICLIWWIYSFFAIPYWVYCLNFHTYRKNIYEKLIVGKKVLKYKALCSLISKGFQKDHSVVTKTRQRAEAVYSEKQSNVSKFFSFATNSKVTHAREKAQDLYNLFGEISPIATKHAEMTSELVGFLNIERRNAYRNMILAKELVFLIRNAKHNQDKLKVDSIGRMDISTPTDINADISNLAPVDFRDSFASGFSSFDKTFTLMQEFGIKDSDSLLISLGVGSIEFAIDSIGQINSRRTAEREHYEFEASLLIEKICNLEENLLDNDTKLLRANEIMMSLSAANEAFVKAYVPLRDWIFGEQTSIGSFFTYQFGTRHKRRAAAMSNEIAHLITVCSLYNKINKAKI